tara:strand:- start:1159 stop:1455 length:297 start_codon:yes stop_codon:yes gene_type:complete
MTEIFIFSLGISIGCSVSYIFFKIGIKSNLDAYNHFAIHEPAEDKKASKNDDYDPQMDTDLNETSMDWDSYPYTNEYNDQDSEHQIIGYIDPDTDEPN